MDNFLKVVIILSVTCTSNLCIAASLNYHILVCFLTILQKLRIMSYILSLPMPNNRHSTLFFLDLLPVSAGSKLLVLLYSVLQEFEKSCFTKDTQVCTWEKLLGNLTLFSTDFGSKPNLVVPIPAEVVVLSKHNAKWRHLKTFIILSIMERHMLLCTSSFVKHFMLFISVSTRLCEQTQVTDISLTPSQHFPDSQATVSCQLLSLGYKVQDYLVLFWIYSSTESAGPNLPC